MNNNASILCRKLSKIEEEKLFEGDEIKLFTEAKIESDSESLSHGKSDKKS